MMMRSILINDFRVFYNDLCVSDYSYMFLMCLRSFGEFLFCSIILKLLVNDRRYIRIMHIIWSAKGKRN